MTYVYIFVYSSIIGSFLHVFAQNFPQQKSFLFRRSHCDHCEKPLSYHQMIPIFSYLIQKGRTKCCEKKLSPLYIIQEICLPFLILLFYGLFKFEFMTSIHFIIFLFLYFFVLTDLYFLHVPNLMILLFFFIVCLYRFFYYSMTLIFIQFIVSLFVYSLFYFFVRKGFGLGDIKILIILGTALGFANSYKIFFISLVLALLAIGSAVLLQKFSRAKMIPFVPFLFLGYICYLFLEAGVVL